MWILVLRRLLIVLTGLSFLIGVTVHAMARPELMASGCMDAAQTATDDCCAKMAMKDHATRAPMKHVPCKGISLDCANQLGCISSQALLAPSTALGSPTRLWMRGILAALCLANRPVGQTRTFPPYSHIANHIAA